jgi:hypothetical protein
MSAPDFSKLLDHPDNEAIVSKLVTGEPVKDVAEWLKIKYDRPEQSHLRLPTTLLKQFLDSNLDLYSTMRVDLDQVKSGTINRKVAASLKNNKTYQERLAEVAGNEIDIKNTLQNIVNIIQVRVEQVFDKMQQNPENMKPDYVLIKWFEVLLNSTEKLDKIVNNRPDTIIQHNINVQTMEQHTAVVQDAIRETLAEMDPDAAFSFIEKINQKMAGLKAPEQQAVLSQEKRLQEAQLLTSIVTDKIEDI